MLKLTRVFITNGDIELLEKSRNLLLDMSEYVEREEAEITILNLSRLIGDFKTEMNNKPIETK